MDLEKMSIEEIIKEIDELFDAKEYRKVIEIVEKLPKNRWNQEIVSLVVASYNNAEEFQTAIDCLNENVDLCKENMAGWHYKYAYATYWMDLYLETLEHALKSLEAEKCDVELEGRYNQVEDMAGYSVRQINKKQIGDEAFREYANELYDKIKVLHKNIINEVKLAKLELAAPKKKFVVYINTFSYYKDDGTFKKLVNENKDKLSKEELIEALLLLSENHRLEEMVVFLEETKISCTLKVAVKCMKDNCYGNYNVDISNLFYKLTDLFIQGLSKGSGTKLLFEVFCLAIDSVGIHLFEQVVNRDDFPVFDESQIEKINKKISKVNGRIAREYFEYYMEHGVVKQGYEHYYSNGLYRPKLTSKEYFEYDAWDNCQRCLKDYGKKKLLDPETSKKKLWNFFYYDYNWDDGVDVPYFVLSHPNCDLELKKLLYDLVGCEFITEETYEKAETDPEMYFLIMLDKMVKKEEACK